MADRSVFTELAKTVLFSAAVVAAGLSLNPAASHAMIFWDDEMEPGSTGYEHLVEDGYPCGDMPGFNYDTVVKVSGAGSMKETFPGLQFHQQCGGYADRGFPATDDLWGRFYIRLSPNFIVSEITTKVMRNDTDTNLDHWWGMPWGQNVLAVALQNYPTTGDSRNFYANVGDGKLTLGEWVCIETHIKHNTVGQANGLVEAFKNDELFLSYTGLEIRKVSEGTQNAHFVSNRMYRQDGQGSIHYDRVAFGDSRIGCLDSVPPVDDMSPMAPVGLSVQ